jgi:multisubunit Na+/H+ antiporter MnhC subunit
MKPTHLAYEEGNTRGKRCEQARMFLKYLYLFVVTGRIMIMKATHLYGQDDQPRKKSLMDPIVQGVIVSGIVCGMLTALAAVLRYGTEGHSFPTLRVSRRNSPLA